MLAGSPAQQRVGSTPTDSTDASYLAQSGAPPRSSSRIAPGFIVLRSAVVSREVEASAQGIEGSTPSGRTGYHFASNYLGAILRLWRNW